MKNIKRLIAALLAIMIVLSFAGCHKKNEIAVTIGDVEFTSAYYMCALVSADAEARNLVYENLTDEELNSATEIDYYSKKIEEKDYITWVEDTAMDTLKEIAAYKILCKENKIELDEEEIANAEAYVDYYWGTAESGGVAAYFEPNGVYKETYAQFMKDSYYAESYFEFLYGKGGEKEIADDKVVESMTANFVLANVLEGAFSEEMTDEDKAALKTQFETYAAALTDGSRTFEDIYKEYNQITDEVETEEHSEDDGHNHDAETTETTEETESAETEEAKPKDEYASVIGSEDSGYNTEYYETVKEMAVGEVKVITLENDAGYVLAVKQDILGDEYYKDQLDMSSRHFVADEEYEKTIADYAKTLKVEVNNYAVKQFKVKKIEYPQTTTA